MSSSETSSQESDPRSGYSPQQVQAMTPPTNLASQGSSLSFGEVIRPSHLDQEFIQLLQMKKISLIAQWLGDLGMQDSRNQKGELRKPASVRTRYVDVMDKSGISVENVMNSATKPITEAQWNAVIANAKKTFNLGNYYMPNMMIKTITDAYTADQHEAMVNYYMHSENEIDPEIHAWLQLLHELRADPRAFKDVLDRTVATEDLPPNVNFETYIRSSHYESKEQQRAILKSMLVQSSDATERKFIAALLMHGERDPIIIARYKDVSLQEYYHCCFIVSVRLGLHDFKYVSHPVPVDDFNRMAPFIDQAVYNAILSAFAGIRAYLGAFTLYDLAHDKEDALYMPFCALAAALGRRIVIATDIHVSMNGTHRRFIESNYETDSCYKSVYGSLSKSRFYTVKKN